MKRLMAATLLLAGCASDDPARDAASADAADSDAPAYAESYGVSADEAERRLAAQEDVGRLQEAMRDDPAFGGLYIEHEPRFRVVVLFVTEPEKNLARYTRDPLYEAAQAQYSLRTLEEGQRQLGEELERENIHFKSTSVDVKRNRVVLEVADRTEMREAAAAGRILLPGFVVIDETGGVIASPQRLGPVISFPQAKYPAGGYMQALGSGELELRNGCLRLVGAPGDGLLIVWPSMALLEERAGKISVRNPDTGAVVSVGDFIEIGGGGGGSVREQDLAEAIPETCPGPYWFAAPEWRRVDLN